MPPREYALIGSVMVLAACGCRMRPSDPATRLQAQWALRQQGAARSMELYQRGMEAYRASNLPQARSLFSEAVASDRRNAHAWMALGVAELELDDLFEAADAFHQAGRLEPSRYEPHYNLGMLYESIGRYEQAAAAYESALERAPGQTELLENLARCYIRGGFQLDRARQLIQEALPKENRPEWREWLERQRLRLAPEAETPP